MSIVSLVGFLLLVNGWLAPNHYEPWLTFHGEIISAAGAFFLALDILIKKREILLPYAISAPAILMTALLVFQRLNEVLLFNSDFYYGLVYVGIWIISGAVGSDAARKSLSGYHSEEISNTKLTGFLWAATAGAIVSGIIGTLQWLHLPLTVWMVESDGRAYANFAQPNNYATLLVMGIASLGYLLFIKKIKKWIFLCGTLFLCFGVLGSESRTGFIAVILVFAIWTTERSYSNKNRNPWLYFALIVGLWFCARFLWPSFSTFMGVAASRDATDFNSSSRLILWRQLGEALLLRPWNGYGWLQVGRAQDTIAPFYGASATASAHNIFFDVALWFGIPSAIILLMMNVKWFWRLRKDFRPIILYPLAVLAPLVLHSMLEFPYEYAFFLIPSGILVGFISSALGYRSLKFSRGAFLALLILLAASGFALTKIQLSYEEPMRMALADEQKFREEEIIKPPKEAFGFGQDVYALFNTLTHTGPETDATVKEAAYTSWRYPSRATHRRRVLSLFKAGQQKSACRALAAFQSLYDADSYEKLVISVKISTGLNSKIICFQNDGN
ncbi:O-antigen polymerase [Paracidovorax avenae ATCC 19860]|uniref:O-antigen polymerase n=1 Tax=Paracidovorax avenae (strain ATCC 19860 / DSM 7227 / CCUG 15838 / JCM 20985 / LMG 2117 / NCPPB 1011) TaxID=643561 RepID=F0QB02_PARA1|nr:O-antigen ligase family protein [Paracidovorax avenae]ADX48497.1 O-antigen polymerase [Paracidovorax avenae ATCC 19860]